MKGKVMTERMVIMKILGRIGATITYGDENTIECSVGSPYGISFDFNEKGDVTGVDTFE